LTKDETTRGGINYAPSFSQGSRLARGKSAFY